MGFGPWCTIRADVMASFHERLRAAWRDTGSFLCVGLDPQLERMPDELLSSATPLLDFGLAVVEACGPHVCAFKPQIAFYSAVGAERELELTIRAIRERCPGVLVILDAKRGDVASTAERYVREAFDRYGADAVTVNPYLGADSVLPFLARRDRGAIVVCRSSNPGAATLQDLVVDGEPLFARLARVAVAEWSANDNLALVMGATYPSQLAQVRRLAPELPFLVPGIGAQGGDLRASLRAGLTAAGDGVIVSASRSVIYAGGRAAIAAAARDLAAAIRREREAILAG